MSNPSEEPSLDSLVGALRSDVVKVDGAARERIHGRLSAGVLTQLFGSALFPAFLQNGLVKSTTFAKTKAFAVAVALPAGIAIGASGHAWYEGQHSAREPVVQVAAAAAPPAPVAAAPVAAAPAPLASPVASAEPSSPPAARSRPAAKAARFSWQPLNRELSLLEKARTLLSEGKTETTLSLIAKHEQRYPRSTLDQERRALHIKALIAANRTIEARARAVAFVRSYPNSTLRSSVEKSVASIP
ncbi:MAG TPA: hypothetical protein VG937_37130 [Polyangiaceae bacterium]|nr:hypothetical protein [Polyangiaceae bacterium]